MQAPATVDEPVGRVGREIRRAVELEPRHRWCPPGPQISCVCLGVRACMICVLTPGTPNQLRLPGRASLHGLRAHF